MQIRNKEIFEIHASYCRLLANPIRLTILACLDVREMSVGELAELIESPMSSASRHLSALKSHHLIASRKEGTKVFYRPYDPKIAEACTLIRTVLIDGMKKRGEIAKGIEADELIQG
jgi:DNA-binding transcriptional ArsR family regulator